MSSANRAISYTASAARRTSQNTHRRRSHIVSWGHVPLHLGAMGGGTELEQLQMPSRKLLALFDSRRVTAGLAESNGSLPPTLGNGLPFLVHIVFVTKAALVHIGH